MNPQQYAAFTAALQQNLECDPRVLGLMTAGSMARQSHQPDEWSDHDFWVVVEPGTEIWFRTCSEWLPDSDQIVLMFTDPVHDGVTAIYESGHLAEFAASDRDTLLRAKVNDYRLLIDKIGLSAEVAQLQQATAVEFEKIIEDDQYLMGRFLTSLLVGIGRYRRGEHMSARQFIYVSALQALLRLIAKHVPPEQPVPIDNLDPLRRFEAGYPILGAEINTRLQPNLDRVALELLELADRVLGERLANYPIATVEAVHHRILS